MNRNNFLFAMAAVNGLWCLPAFGQDPQPSNSATVRSQIPFVPGAIVCSDLQTVYLVVNIYRTHFTESVQDAVTGGRSQMVRPTENEPELASFGCALLEPGTTVKVIATFGGAVKVEGRDKAGQRVSGVTAFYMLDR